MNGNYIFDKDDIRFRKKKTSVWAVIRRILMFFVASVSMAVLYYVLFALVFSTEEEKALILELPNDFYEYDEDGNVIDELPEDITPELPDNGEIEEKPVAVNGNVVAAVCRVIAEAFDKIADIFE